MIYNDTSTKTGILQNCEMRLFGDNGYGQITSDTNRLYQFADRCNRALDRFVFLALTADGRWEFDDTNNTDLSIATTSIVSGQNQYSFNLEQLEIEKVLVKDSNGNWHVIKAAGINDPDVGSFLENGTSQTGTPTRYFKRGQAIFLDYTPNYNSSAGFKIYFKRGGSYFVYSDTTKAPGIPSIFHKYIALQASYTYAQDRIMTVAQSLSPEVTKEEQSIQKFYGSRAKDDKPKMRPAQQCNR
jgi:hypothetical protein